MKVIRKTFSQNIPMDMLPFPLDKSIFFDIETTGFTARTSFLYMIGLVRFLQEDQFETIQFLAEDKSEEPVILYSFLQEIKGKNYLVSFNGNGFDLPFLRSKCQTYQLIFPADALESIDLYKEACRFQPLFQTENMKQKTLEMFFGIHRDDTYSGGELISIYEEYVRQKKEYLEEILFLHNYDDICGMISLLQIYSYSSLFKGNFSSGKCSIQEYRGFDGLPKKELLCTLHPDYAIPQNISISKNSIYLSLHEDTGTLRIPVYQGELKFYYPDYKNYYYLPKEDCAIHKSVAFYVDREFRTQAKASTCYIKKSGCFLPEFDHVITPCYKRDYHEKTSYFKAEETFFDDKEKLNLYMSHILSTFIK